MTPDIFPVLDSLAAGIGNEIQLADGINYLAKNYKVEKVLFCGERFDCGSVEGYTDAIISTKKNKLHFFDKQSLMCFQAYDVRGKVGESVTEASFYQIAKAFQYVLNAKKVIVGRDNRFTSYALMESVIGGLISLGCEVIILDLCGTEEMYFASAYYNADGGMQITASHNPIEYNGIKFIGNGAAPLEGKTSLEKVRTAAEKSLFKSNRLPGKRSYKSLGV